MSYLENRTGKTRAELMEDFEITFANWFTNGTLSKETGIPYEGASRREYTDEVTRQRFSVWILAFETYAGYVSG